MSDEKKLSFEDAKSVIESCYGFDDATTPAGEAWAIVNDKIATLEKRLEEADTERKTLRGHYLSNKYLTELEDKCADYTLLLEAAEQEKQQAIDAALESVVEYLRERGRTCNRESTASIKRANGNITIYSDNLSKEANKLFHYANDVESKFKGTNPLAEAQAQMNKITGLYQRLEAFAEKRIAELERDLAEAKKDAERYEAKLFALGAMEEPPCFKCGYNGPGYFQTATHPCAHNHHNAMRQEGE